MATPQLQSILQSIANELVAEVVGGGDLSFMVGEPEAISITDRKPDPSNYKNYKHHKIVIYPSSTTVYRETRKMGSNIKREYVVSIPLDRDWETWQTQ